ncbi:LTA synthase family protein [Burkholderia metallica]|uniref:LTA synthase family protein n=1 Tax=Burkholderia metallica TaxID=488729 RepID=UPI001452DAA1|nr:LTA synthase family protein [Burkholderia metallica]VWB14533.1 capsular polysaccharide biosynthesis protein [Burkholderia metallica]
MSGSHTWGLAATVAFSFAFDAVAIPRAPIRRPLLSSALHILSVLFLFDLLVAVTSRPLFSACATLALVGLVAAVSNAKYESLREPFVFTDLSLFSQLFSHPRLYLPFLSVGKLAAIGAGIVLVIAGFVVERSVSLGSPAMTWLAVVLPFALAVSVAARLPLTLDPNVDQGRHGFFAVFVAYLLNGLRPTTFRRLLEVVAAGPFAIGEPRRRPDVIVIQSESFFDARRLGDTIASGLYGHFDDARREAVWHGEMSVPAWGANTMRTEFAVLTGTETFALGYARFYPYAFVRRRIASLASWLGCSGYDTTAIHPYYADFFGRNRVFPLLGFAHFLDIGHFASASRAGPYVADVAVSDAIVSKLSAADRGRPQFLFAMTMENHGPLHLERVLPGESTSRHTLGEDASWRDLTAYLRHIENADAMIGRLLDYLRTSDRETVVCFYGDHVPALPHVFEKLGVIPQTSDYFIWRNYGTDTPECRNLAAEELGSVLLHVVQDDGNRTEQPCASEKAT